VSGERLFRPRDRVRHYKGGLYRVESVGRDERTGEDKYAYRAADGTLWFREVGEMEDGRFTLEARGLGPEESERTLDSAVAAMREAAEVLESVGSEIDGVEALVERWRWPLADELHGLAAVVEEDRRQWPPANPVPNPAAGG
jgi:hypothetical protein